MSIIGSNILAGAAGSGVSAYEIEQSLRFDGSSGYLSRTHSNNNASSDFTLSMWFKKAYNGENNMMLLHTNTDPRYSYVTFGESSGDADLLIARGASGYYAFGVTRKYRDPSAWYHIVLSVDVGTITKGYVNGVLDSNAGGTGNWAFNGTDPQAIGRQAGVASNYFSGYMAEVHFIDGQALDADSFGEFDDNGVWRPIEYTGTYGSNGFYLKFDPSATNGIGHDHSGNGNNWTPTGFTTSGTGTDVMSDTPTTNWCTLNAVDNLSGATLANGNLETTSAAANYKSNFGTIFASSGKWYAEFTVLAGSNDTRMIPGVGTKQTSVTTNLGNDAYSYSLNYNDGGSTIYKRTNNTNTALSSTDDLTTNSVVMIALDLDNNKLWFGQDGTWFDSGAPASGTNEIFTITAGEYTFMPCTFSDGKFAVNFGQRAFAYTPPTGFKALNTSNLPAPTVKDGSDYFNTVLYSGNGTSQSLTVGFQPDWIWTKPRNATGAHVLVDAVRGNTKFLESNSTGAEQTRTGNDGVTSFDTNGYSIGSSADWNASSETFVSWNWLAGGSGSSNTDGSITSTVSVNPSAGFSIVSFNSGASGAKTVGHGLGVAPQWIITKDRDNATNWTTYHASATTATDKYINLNGVAGVQTASGIWGSTLPTSTVFGFGSGTASAPNADCIAYCFAEVEGYSKFGSFTANNSANGPFVYCGFKPAWFIIKGTVGNTLWGIFDVARNTYNPLTQGIFQDSSAEAALGNFDFLSNGFKIRTTAWNDPSFGAIIFAAFAENPFGGSGVSPATAR